MNNNNQEKDAIAGISIRLDYNSTYVCDISSEINDLIGNLSSKFVVHQLMTIGSSPRESVTQLEIEILFGSAIEEYFSETMYQPFEPRSFPFELCSPLFEEIEKFLHNTDSMKQVTLVLNFKKHVLRIINLNINLQENLNTIFKLLHPITSKQELAIDGGEIILPVSKISEAWSFGGIDKAEYALGGICDDNLNHSFDNYVFINTRGWGGSPVILQLRTGEWQIQTESTITGKFYWTMNDWKLFPDKTNANTA